MDNLAFACQGCNGHKYNKTEAFDPVTKKLVPLFHPRRQEWNEHFRSNDDYSLIFGITATGRATVAALQLNRDNVINLRRVLYAVGKHPAAKLPDEL